MKNKFQPPAPANTAFTLMELLIVIAIIAILTMAFLPNLLKAPAKARDAVRLKTVANIQNAVEAYIAEKGKIPIPPPTSSPWNLYQNDNSELPCFHDRLGGSDILNITIPYDPSSIGSCTSASTGIKKYYYYYYKINTPSPLQRYYVVGSKLETAGLANTNISDLSALNSNVQNQTLDEVKNIIKQSSTGIYYILVGPR